MRMLDEDLRGKEELLMRVLIAANFEERPDDNYILAGRCDYCERKIAIYENKDGLTPGRVICKDCYQEAVEMGAVKGR